MIARPWQLRNTIMRSYRRKCVTASKAAAAGHGGYVTSLPAEVLSSNAFIRLRAAPSLLIKAGHRERG